MGKSTISMAIFNSYVKLPEGNFLEDLEPMAHNTRSLAQKTAPENLLQLLLPHAMRFIMNSSQTSAHCI